MRTEKEIKQNTYNILMKSFVELYDGCAEYVSGADSNIENNINLFYDLLSANGIFSLRNKYFAIYSSLLDLLLK